MVLEICVDSVDSAKAAQTGGAERVELCSALSEGGVTPSCGLIESVRAALGIPVFVIIRPRSGDFFYSDDEFAVMRHDVLRAKSYGVDGVVLGLLHHNGEVDIPRTRELVELARPMSVTFHRAIDWVPKLDEALDQVIETGADRILTSGGAQTALQGMTSIARMVANAGSRIRVMVCGTVRRENVGEIARVTRASEFHAALRKQSRSPVTYGRDGLSLGVPGMDEFARYAVAANDVRALRDAMQVDLAS